MSQDKEYQALARRFVDLWQERMSVMMQDGEFVRLLLKMVHGMPFSANTGTAAGNSGFGESIFNDLNANRPQPRSPAHAPDAGDAAVARVEERIAAIERAVSRLADVAAQPAKPRGARRPVAKNAKRPAAQKRRRIRGKR